MPWRHILTQCWWSGSMSTGGPFNEQFIWLGYEDIEWASGWPNNGAYCT
jgi:hypothetical protein